MCPRSATGRLLGRGSPLSYTPAESLLVREEDPDTRNGSLALGFMHLPFSPHLSCLGLSCSRNAWNVIAICRYERWLLRRTVVAEVSSRPVELGLAVVLGGQKPLLPSLVYGRKGSKSSKHEQVQSHGESVARDGPAYLFGLQFSY